MARAAGHESGESYVGKESNQLPGAQNWVRPGSRNCTEAEIARSVRDAHRRCPHHACACTASRAEH